MFILQIKEVKFPTRRHFYDCIVNVSEDLATASGILPKQIQDFTRFNNIVTGAGMPLKQ